MENLKKRLLDLVKKDGGGVKIMSCAVTVGLLKDMKYRTVIIFHDKDFKQAWAFGLVDKFATGSLITGLIAAQKQTDTRNEIVTKQ